MERIAGTRCFGDQALKLRAQAALPEIKSRIKGWNDAMYAERSDFLVERYGFDRGMVNRITDPQFWGVGSRCVHLPEGCTDDESEGEAHPTITPFNIRCRAEDATEGRRQIRNAGDPDKPGRSQMESAAALLASRRAQHQR